MDSLTKVGREPQHVCGLQGFGALGDVCPKCALDRARYEARIAAPAPEPVAWRYIVNGVHIMFDDAEPPDDAYDEGTLTPLYAAPPAAPPEPADGWGDAIHEVATAPPEPAADAVCEHDEIDVDTAFADGLCPLCLHATVEQQARELAAARECIAAADAMYSHAHHTGGSPGCNACDAADAYLAARAAIKETP